MSKLTFQVIPDKTYRPANGDFVFRVALKMGVSDLAEVLPSHICLAIDRSMSMTGEKIEQARQAAMLLVDTLGANDRFSLLTFSGSVEILIDNAALDDAGRQIAKDAIADIKPGGVTRMDLALDEAFGQLNKSDDNYLKTLLLLSDGAPTNSTGYVLSDVECDALVNRIATTHREQGVSTSTIGLGDAEDCLAPFLEGAAERGGGVFYHEDEPAKLADRFIEAFKRFDGTAISSARFVINKIHGHVRKASSILPDIRQLEVAPKAQDDTQIVMEAGALQKGEEHVFLMEVLTPDGDLGKKALCDVSVTYNLDGEEVTQKGQPILIEYTDNEQLLLKPGHGDVEKYKNMLNAFTQTQKAAANMREGGDPKKTKVLLQAAAKTTRKLGMAKQTKLLNDVAQQLEEGQDVTENQLTAVTTASRKTRLLTAP